MFFTEDRKPILGIYTQPGRWYYLKYIVFLLLMYFKKFMNSLYQTKISIDNKEKPQPLSDHFNAFDAAFFIASNSDGFYIVTGIERRPMGIFNGLFYLIIPGKGILSNSTMPDTLLFGTNRNSFDAGGIKLTSVVPMEEWNVSFEGKMKYEDNPEVTVDVKFEGIWKAKWDIFNYDTDLDIQALARSIAREKWEKSLVKNLKDAHQSHYEQIGKMSANIVVDGIEYKTTMDSFRDRSCGQRNWKLMHRYAFHHIFCKSGMSIVVGIISQPCTTSLLEVGYVCLPGSKECIPIRRCDLKLYQHGESGSPPKDYAFTIEAGGAQYVIRVNVLYESDHFKGFNWDVKLRERFIKYLVNEEDIGWGVSDFVYNNKSGRSEKCMESDPEWYKTLHRERIAF